MANRSKWVSEEDVAHLQRRVLEINNRFDAGLKALVTTYPEHEIHAEFTSRNRARLQEIANMLGEFLGIDVEIHRLNAR